MKIKVNGFIITVVPDNTRREYARTLDLSVVNADNQPVTICYKSNQPVLKAEDVSPIYLAGLILACERTHNNFLTLTIEEGAK